MTQEELRLAANGSLDRRRAMVDGQIRTFDVTDQRLLDMFYRIPREATLPSSLEPLAYSDAPIVLPGSTAGTEGRVLMQPMFLAKLLQNAAFDVGQKVLVVAGATGYAAAIVVGLTGSVVTLDSDAALTEQARAFAVALGFGEAVQAVTGPLEAGYPAGAPYDRIIVVGAVERGLEALFDQLAPNGCLLAIVTNTNTNQASRRSGKAMRFDKIGQDISSRALFDATVPVLDAFREPPAFVF